MKGVNTIAGLFGKSPFKPMQEHVRVVAQCAEHVVPLFEAMIAGDDAALAEQKELIFDFEQQADDVKNSIRAHLPKSLFMPVDRRDLLDLLHAQDSIADSAQDIAGFLTMRKMALPDFLRDGLLPFVRRNVDAVHVCQNVINELDELLEMGFKGRAVDRAEKLVDELAKVESDGDQMGMDLCTQLFAHEESIKPLDVIFWFQLIETIGDIADYAEDVGDRLRLLIAR